MPPLCFPPRPQFPVRDSLNYLFLLHYACGFRKFFIFFAPFCTKDDFGLIAVREHSVCYCKEIYPERCLAYINLKFWVLDVFLTTCTWNNLSPLTLRYKPRNMTKILEQMEHLFLCVMSNEVNLLVYDLHLKLKRQYKERQLIGAITLARKGGWIAWRDWPTNCVLTSRIPFLTLHFYWTTVFSLSLSLSVRYIYNLKNPADFQQKFNQP